MRCTGGGRWLGGAGVARWEGEVGTPGGWLDGLDGKTGGGRGGREFE